MSVQKGQYFSLSYGGTTIGEITSLSLSIDGNQINISSFDSGKFEKFLRGRNNVTLNCGCRYDFEDAAQLSLIDDALDAAEDEFVFGPSTPVAGDVIFTGDGSTSNISIDASDEDVANITFDIQINGELVKSVTT